MVLRIVSHHPRSSAIIIPWGVSALVSLGRTSGVLCLGTSAGLLSAPRLGAASVVPLGTSLSSCASKVLSVTLRSSKRLSLSLVVLLVGLGFPEALLLCAPALAPAPDPG